MVVNTSANDCLERLVPEMTYYVLRGTLNYSLTRLNNLLIRPIICYFPA